MLRWIAVFVVLIAAVPAASSDGAPAQDEFTPPPGLDVGWYARIETSRGRILARLLPEQAPQSVAHFASLAEGRLEWFDSIAGKAGKGPYYDGVEIYRSEAGRLFETGDRYGTGDGAPRVYVAEEGLGPIDFSRPGRLGMTRLTGGRISGVLFFATASAQPWLNRTHPCFGAIVAGIDVVQAISEVKTYSDGHPIEPLKVESVRIFAVGQPPALPEPVPYEPQRREIMKREEAPAPS